MLHFIEVESPTPPVFRLEDHGSLLRVYTYSRIEIEWEIATWICPSSLQMADKSRKQSQRPWLFDEHLKSSELRYHPDTAFAAGWPFCWNFKIKKCADFKSESNPLPLYEPIILPIKELPYLVLLFQK